MRGKWTCEDYTLWIEMRGRVKDTQWSKRANSLG